MAKKGFLDGYKTYNPKKEGYGSPAEWSEAFSARMGLNKAKETLGSQDPYLILGVTKSSTWDEIKRAYRKLIMKHHPDRNEPDDEKAKKSFLQARAAFEILEDIHDRKRT